MQKVSESVEQKKHDTALQALKTTLEEATSLYTSSEGQVADNATRDALKTRIDTAQKLSMNMKATVDELTKALAPLSDAMSQVNQSIQAKAQADAQAQAQAQAQQQAQSQHSTPQRRSGGSTPRRSGGNSGGSSGGSGSWSVPGEQGEAYLPGSLG